MFRSLFTPVRLGDIYLKNRIVMAPMTRSRARPDGVPTPEMVEYYKQRAGAGMIITEGTQPSFEGQGYARTPGLHTADQSRMWTKITELADNASCPMIAQLMHVGRIANCRNKFENARTLAPSVVRAEGSIYTDDAGMQPFDEPEEMTLADIKNTVSDYAHAASTAMESGFSGIEIHATSGYLPAQFLSTGTNKRNDQYGGNCENRIRFLIEIVQAVSDAVSNTKRVGVRICPGNPFNDLSDNDPEETFSALLNELNQYNLAYLHVIRMPSTGLDNFEIARKYFGGPYIFNDSFTPEEADAFLVDERCDAISFGRPFIANPDFPSRVRKSLYVSDVRTLYAEFNPKLLYTPGPEGYSDYPTLPQR